MVSVDPIKVDATRPTKESGPCTLNMSDSIARDALPEIGRRKTIGSASGGILKILVTGLTAKSEDSMHQMP